MSSTKISSNFESFWQSLEPKAKGTGMSDGDLAHARSSVKNVLVAAGWSDSSGRIEFLSSADQAACENAALAEVQRIAPSLVQSRKLVFTDGFHPTRHSLSAQTQPQAALAEMTPVVSSNFHPTLAKVGDNCPRCSGAMQAVGLVNDRSALYCPKDRVVMPLPSGVSLR